MVPRQAFLIKIRQLDYSFCEQKKRVYLYRRKNGTAYIAVPKADLLSEEYVEINLRRSGLTEEEILKFIGEAKG
jgi:hypothetical protein